MIEAIALGWLFCAAAILAVRLFNSVMTREAKR